MASTSAGPWAATSWTPALPFTVIRWTRPGSLDATPWAPARPLQGTPCTSAKPLNATPWMPARRSGVKSKRSCPGSKGSRQGAKAMKRYVIERNLPGVGGLSRAEFKSAAAASNSALAKLPGRVQWVQSYVADDKTFCIYLADSEATVEQHACLSGFPATKITEIRGIIDPMTAMA